jgi:hypothetical protein
LDKVKVCVVRDFADVFGGLRFLSMLALASFKMTASPSVKRSLGDPGKDVQYVPRTPTPHPSSTMFLFLVTTEGNRANSSIKTAEESQRTDPVVPERDKRCGA